MNSLRLEQERHGQAGQSPTPNQPDPAPAPQPAFWQRHGEAILTLLCALLVIAGWLAERQGFSGLAIALHVPGYLAGAYIPARDAFRLLVRERELDVDLLMVLAAIGAAAIGHWWEGGVLIFIFSLSGTLETYAMAYTRREISALMSLNPDRATLLHPDGTTTVVPASTLQVGNRVVVRAGDRIPADGVVLEGASAVDQAAITGEALAVEKTAGDPVFAGTINGTGVLTVTVTADPQDTVLARIIRMVAEAREEKPPSALFIDRFERIYARIIVLGATLVAFLPPLLWQESFTVSWYRAMVLLVAASPCALTMSIMPTLVCAIATAARSGILLKGGRHLENLAHVRCVALDKTGTLTRGQPVVTDVIPLNGVSRDDVLRHAAAVESRSEHPLAAAIGAAAAGLTVETPRAVEVLVGRGIAADLDSGRWVVGGPVLFEAPSPLAGPHGMAAAVQQQVQELVDDGKTVMLVAPVGGSPIGIIAVRDELRPDAAAMTAALKSMGITVAMLTGDNPRTAAAIARLCGVDEVHAGLMPEGKVERIRALAARHGPVAMVGDGINDAPALATASVGIAMGRQGTDVAMETADMVLMGDELAKLPYAVRLGRRAAAVTRQNLAFSTAMIALLIVSAFTGWLQMALAVIGHEGSTLLVTLNGLRLLRR